MVAGQASQVAMSYYESWHLASLTHNPRSKQLPQPLGDKPTSELPTATCDSGLTKSPPRASQKQPGWP